MWPTWTTGNEYCPITTKDKFDNLEQTRNPHGTFDSKIRFEDSQVFCNRGHWPKDFFDDCVTIWHKTLKQYWVLLKSPAFTDKNVGDL